MKEEVMVGYDIQYAVKDAIRKSTNTNYIPL